MKKLNFFVNSWRYFGMLLLGLFLSVGHANASEGSGEKFNAANLILHHIQDSHEWHLFTTVGPDGQEHHVSIPLPVIVVADGQLYTFMSSAFHHDGGKVHKGEQVFKLEHDHVVTESGAHVLDFSITKNVASMMISVLLLLVIFLQVGAAYKKRGIAAPKGMQSFFEPIIVFIRDEVARPNIGDKKYEKFFPYLLTAFFFIWFNNMLGLVPTGANATGNIAVTMTLAVFTFLITQFSANKDYWKHIFATPGVPKPVLLIMIPVELLGVFTKPFALMLRLFANITAGHIIILSFISLTFVFQSIAVGMLSGVMVIAMMFMELFVAILQAYIFTQLSALFIGMAVQEHHHDDHGHTHGHEEAVI